MDEWGMVGQWFAEPAHQTTLMWVGGGSLVALALGIIGARTGRRQGGGGRAWVAGVSSPLARREMYLRRMWVFFAVTVLLGFGMWVAPAFLSEKVGRGGGTLDATTYRGRAWEGAGHALQAFLDARAVFLQQNGCERGVPAHGNQHWARCLRRRPRRAGVPRVVEDVCGYTTRVLIVF